MNYHTTYRNVSEKKKRRIVNVKGESAVNSGKCTMERTSLRPRTITIPPSKTCTTGTTLKSLGIPVIEDDTGAGVLRKRTVDEKMIRSITEGTLSIGTVPGQVSEMLAEHAIILDAAVLWVAGSLLTATGALVLRAVDMEMACGMTLKTTSCRVHNGFWAQVGIVRCNACRIGGCATLVKSRSSVSRDVRRDIEQCSGGGLG